MQTIKIILVTALLALMLGTATAQLNDGPPLSGIMWDECWHSGELYDMVQAGESCPDLKGSTPAEAISKHNMAGVAVKHSDPNDPDCVLSQTPGVPW